MTGERPQLPPEVWRLRAENLHKVLQPTNKKEHGRSPLSAAEMLLLDNTRAQLRSALRLADLGDQAAARFAVLKLLDENEEVLLHVFGGILPLTYELGALAPALMDDVRLGSAASQADQLVKTYPEHMVGRLSRAALKLYTKANADALAVLTPMPRQLGAFGLLRGMAAVAEALVKVDAAANKAEGALLSSNEAAVYSLKAYSLGSATDHAWEHLTEVRGKLLIEHTAATRSSTVPQSGCVSLRAAGCFQVGLMSQSIEICEAWLQKAPAHELHLWAHVLAFFAKVNLSDQPEQLRKASGEIAVVLEDGKQHPSVQLESKAFAGLPRKVLQYVTHVEGLVTRVQRLADSVEFVASREQEAADISDASSLVPFLEASVEACTNLLSSEDKGLSLASSARILLHRAQCRLQLREMSLALTDLAYAFALRPSLEIVTLWGQVLKKVGAARPLRALVRTVEAATPYASSTAAKKEALDDWRRIILCWLQPADSAQLAAEGVLYPFQYLLLCNNRSSTARGVLEVPLRENKCNLLAAAFGKHIGLPLPQVLSLMKHAIEPQSLMMTANREAHRAVPAGPTLQPAAFSTLKLALTFIPVIPADLQARTAPVSAKQQAYAGSAANPRGTGSGYFRRGGRPFSRRGTPTSAPQPGSFSASTDEAHETAAGSPPTAPFTAPFTAPPTTTAPPSTASPTSPPTAPSSAPSSASSSSTYAFQTAPAAAPQASGSSATGSSPTGRDSSATQAPGFSAVHVSDWAPPQCDNPEGEADASKASDQDSPGVGKAAASGGCGAPSASPSSDDQPGMEPCVSESGGIGKGKGAQERPVIDITASAGQESAQPPQKGDDTAATESIAANAAASTPCSGAGGLAEAAAAPAEANAAVNGNPQTTKAGTNAKWEVPAFIAATDSTQQSQSSFAFGSQGPTSHSNSSAPFCPQRPSLFDPLSGTPRGPSVGSTPLEDRPSLSRFTSEQQSSSPAAFTFGQKLAFPSASCSFGQQATLFGQQTTAPAVSQPFGQHTAASGGLTAFAFSAASRFDQAASPERAARPFAFGQQAPASADAGQSEEQPFKFSFGQGVGSAPVSQP